MTFDQGNIVDWLRTGLTDMQVAAVVNYVRTHLGNDYRDVVTTEEVTAVRPRKGPVGEVKPPG